MDSLDRAHLTFLPPFIRGESFDSFKLNIKELAESFGVSRQS